MIANLYKHFNERDNEKTYKFIAFGKEEKGLIGSRVWVDAIPRSKRKNYCAMVNFDSFGFVDVWALESISDSSLINLAKETASKRNFVFETRNYPGASSDSKSFQQKNIPAITLSGLDDNWRKYLHQEGDQLDNINFSKVYENYLFAKDYLKRIDNRNCESFR
jgi:aminopeptidase YwaD